MKANVTVEFQGKKVSDKILIDKVKETWKEAGNKVKDIKTIDIYLKPEESMCYYVINEKENGSFPV